MGEEDQFLSLRRRHGRNLQFYRVFLICRLFFQSQHRAGGSLVGIVIGSLVGLGAFASITYVLCSMCNRGGMQNSGRPIINRRTRPQVAFIRTRTRIPKDSIPSCTDLWLLEGSTNANKIFRSNHPPLHYTQEPDMKKEEGNSKCPTYLQAGFKYDVALAGYPPPMYSDLKKGLTKG